MTKPNPEKHFTQFDAKDPNAKELEPEASANEGEDQQPWPEPETVPGLQEEYSLELIEQRVKVGGLWYVLREADEATAKEFRNKAGSCLRGAADGGRVIQGVGDLPGFLVSRCLYYAEGPNEGKRVPAEVILKWRSPIISDMFTWVKYHSKLSLVDSVLGKN